MSKNAYLIVGFIAGIGITLIFFLRFDVTWQRRFIIYNFRHELKKEMFRDEVEKIITKNQANFIRRQDFPAILF